MQLCAGVDILNVNVLLQKVSPQLLSLSHSHTEFHTLTLTHTPPHSHHTLTPPHSHHTPTLHTFLTHSLSHSYSLSRSHTSLSHVHSSCVLSLTATGQRLPEVPTSPTGRRSWPLWSPSQDQRTLPLSVVRMFVCDVYTQTYVHTYCTYVCTHTAYTHIVRTYVRMCLYVYGYAVYTTVVDVRMYVQYSSQRAYCKCV